MAALANALVQRVTRPRGRSEYVSLELRADVTHIMNLRPPQPAAAPTTVTVQTLTGGEFLVVLPPDATSAWLKGEIERQSGIPPHQQRLLYGGTALGAGEGTAWAQLASNNIPLAHLHPGILEGVNPVGLILRLRGGVFGAQLGYTAIVSPAPNAINVDTRAKVCVEIDARAAFAQLQQELGRFYHLRVGDHSPPAAAVHENTLHQLRGVVNGLYGGLEISVVRVSPTLVRRQAAGVIDRWDRAGAFGVLLAIRQHETLTSRPFPNDLKGCMLRHFLLDPEQYETGPAVPVRRTVRQVSGDEQRFEASVQPWGQWEPNAHFRVDMRMQPRPVVSSRMPPRPNQPHPNEYPYAEPDQSGDSSELCHSWHFYTGRAAMFLDPVARPPTHLIQRTVRVSY